MRRSDVRFQLVSDHICSAWVFPLVDPKRTSDRLDCAKKLPGCR